MHPRRTPHDTPGQEQFSTTRSILGGAVRLLSTYWESPSPNRGWMVKTTVETPLFSVDFGPNTVSREEAAEMYYKHYAPEEAD